MNLHEETNRARKAYQLANALRASNPSLPYDRLYTAATYMNQFAWSQIAKGNGINVPSEATIIITLQIIKSWVEVMHKDPFEGLS